MTYAEQVPTFVPFTPEQQAEWDEWVAERPEPVRTIARRFPPNQLYWFDELIVPIHSYSEDGTVTVNVFGAYNRCAFERQVFGVNLYELTKCAAIPAGREVGAQYTDQADIAAYIDKVRPVILARRAGLIDLEKELDDEE